MQWFYVLLLIEIFHIICPPPHQFYWDFTKLAGHRLYQDDRHLDDLLHDVTLRYGRPFNFQISIRTEENQVQQW